ncbi:MAG: hypothetical protein Q8P15_03410, partial [Nanoarchaeota archaeon]|nr:hypothetical protein [Nanoarchaeota archaeon]
KHGRMCIVDDNLDFKRVDLKIKDTLNFTFYVNGKTPEQVENEILNNVKDFEDKIILLRLEGILASGKPGDINFKKIFHELNKAYCILKNTTKVSSKEFEEFKVEDGEVEDVEANIIKEHSGQVEIGFDEEEAMRNLMKVFDDEKQEGEKNYDFELRLEKNVVKTLKLDKVWE